eukprot:g6440.t1
MSAVVGSTLASLPEILEGRGEEKMRELMASWKAQPLLLTFGVLLGVAAIGLLILKTQKLMETYREFMKKAA